MPDTAANKLRPVWYNVSPRNQSVNALVSIGHRASGAVLFFGLFWLLYLLDASLASAESFDRFRSIAGHPLSKLVLIGFLWAFLHHFCAGIRFLFLDIHKGADIGSARRTAGSVFAVSILLTLVLGVALW
ncbi:MAG: succinate dehydrogenase, cytochrome b556 subunit [Burkholderiales bacterium]|nr:succinate dehydrogenase, cytochrome b556 subunit [Burkholderiales bacterium]